MTLCNMPAQEKSQELSKLSPSERWGSGRVRASLSSPAQPPAMPHQEATWLEGEGTLYASVCTSCTAYKEASSSPDKYLLSE